MERPTIELLDRHWTMVLGGHLPWLRSANIALCSRDSISGVAARSKGHISDVVSANCGGEALTQWLAAGIADTLEEDQQSLHDAEGDANQAALVLLSAARQSCHLFSNCRATQSGSWQFHWAEFSAAERVKRVRLLCFLSWQPYMRDACTEMLYLYCCADTQTNP